MHPQEERLKDVHAKLLPYFPSSSVLFQHVTFIVVASLVKANFLARLYRGEGSMVSSPTIVGLPLKVCHSKPSTKSASETTDIFGRTWGNKNEISSPLHFSACMRNGPILPFVHCHFFPFTTTFL